MKFIERHQYTHCISLLFELEEHEIERITKQLNKNVIIYYYPIEQKFVLSALMHMDVLNAISDFTVDKDINVIMTKDQQLEFMMKIS